jgi:FKBP-type peptidyl-prolyl cis-trans isomerase FklB
MKIIPLTVIIATGVAVSAGYAQNNSVEPSQATRKAPATIQPTAGLQATAGTNVLADEKSRDSYAIGLAVGRNLAHNLQLQDVEADPELITRAIMDVLSSNATLMTPEQEQQTLEALQTEVRAKLQARQAELAYKNKTEGVAFLAKNKNEPGVVTLPDGLQYKILTAGHGATPVDGDTVTVNYRGTLLDGTEFDSSYKRGHPAQFPVNGVIRGWTEALEKMKVGAKWRLFIPANLAYGEQGRPGIAPNAVLIFDVDLLSVRSPSAAAATPAAPANPTLTSDIVAVHGTNVQILKPEDVKKLQQAQSESAH